MRVNSRDRGSSPQTALIVCDSPEFHEEIEHGCVQIGYKPITADHNTVDFEQALKKYKPSVVIASWSEPDPAALANLRQFSDPLKYVIVWYGEASDESMQSAQDVGASGLLFHPSTTQQFKTTLDFAAARAAHEWDLMAQIAKLADDLETRKFVDRARGIVMQQLGLNEEEAYHLLRRESRRQRKPLKEISQAVIMAKGFLAPGKSLSDE